MTQHYELVYRPETRKHLRQRDAQTARQILDYMVKMSALAEPRSRAERLVGEYQGLWRYRVGDYRVVCEICDSPRKTIIVRAVGHRSDIYELLARIL